MAGRPATYGAGGGLSQVNIFLHQGNISVFYRG